VGDIMKIEYFEEPAPHYIIDDFLTPKAAREILKECVDLEAFFVQSETKAMGDKHLDNCEECKSEADTIRHITRDNQVIYMDKMFANRRSKSKTLNYLHAMIDSIGFNEFAKTSKSIFPILNTTNTSETLISRYGKCEFYGWHKDNSFPVGNRLVTISYYVNKEPSKFEGGKLLLLGGKEIEPKHNRAVIFSSNTIHSVEYVNLAGKAWDEGRFSVQFWVGFDGEFKFR
jgi:Rps23 Pro-64 3,4-dihydroxylase Tpa1-like proline 4-hydroxylase